VHSQIAVAELKPTLTVQARSASIKRQVSSRRPRPHRIRRPAKAYSTDSRSGAITQAEVSEVIARVTIIERLSGSAASARDNPCATWRPHAPHRATT